MHLSGTSSIPHDRQGVQNEGNQGINLHDPKTLSPFLTDEASLQQNESFVMAYQDGDAAKLTSGAAGKIILFPGVSFCVCVAFRVQDTKTWYGLHIDQANSLAGPIRSFKESRAQAPGFTCDKLIVINPNTTDFLQIQGYAQACVEILEGTLADGVRATPIQCFTSGKSPYVGGRRQIALIPEVNRIYFYDENNQHVGTHPYNFQ